MDYEGIVRLDRILVMAGVAFAAVLLLLFQGGAAREMFLPICIAVSVLALVAETGHRYDRKGRTYAMPYFSVPAFMLVILAAASTFWSIDIGRSMAELPKYFLYFLSFWILSRMVDKQRRAAYFIFLLVAGAMMAYSLYEYAFLTGSGTAGPTFPFASPEPFVAFALVLLSMSLGMLMSVWLDGAVLSEEAAGATHIAVLVVSAATALLSSAALLLSIFGHDAVSGNPNTCRNSACPRSKRVAQICGSCIGRNAHRAAVFMAAQLIWLERSKDGALPSCA